VFWRLTVATCVLSRSALTLAKLWIGPLPATPSRRIALLIDGGRRQPCHQGPPDRP
jgi:hypothetical protein